MTVFHIFALLMAVAGTAFSAHAAVLSFRGRLYAYTAFLAALAGANIAVGTVVLIGVILGR